MVVGGGRYPWSGTPPVYLRGRTSRWGTPSSRTSPAGTPLSVRTGASRCTLRPRTSISYFPDLVYCCLWTLNDGERTDGRPDIASRTPQGNQGRPPTKGNVTVPLVGCPARDEPGYSPVLSQLWTITDRKVVNCGQPRVVGTLVGCPEVFGRADVGRWLVGLSSVGCCSVRVVRRRSGLGERCFLTVMCGIGFIDHCR